MTLSDANQYGMSIALVSLVCVFVYVIVNSDDNVDSITDDYKKVRIYLLNDSSIAKSKKPILWIHVKYDINSRKWINFGSRNSTNLNQPYQHLTITSILNACGNDFNVCLITDDTFGKILPGWTVDMSKISDPIKSKIRQLALAKLLYYYGGIIVPSSFACFSSLISYYKEFAGNEIAFISEQRSMCENTMDLHPSTIFMGCKKGNNVMLDYVQFLELLISSDTTSQSDFLCITVKWWKKMIELNKAGLIPGKIIGTVDADNKTITIDDLMCDAQIDFSAASGVYIPADDILSRTSYQWFASLTCNEVITSKTIIGKVLALTQ